MGVHGRALGRWSQREVQWHTRGFRDTMPPLSHAPVSPELAVDLTPTIHRIPHSDSTPVSPWEVHRVGSAASRSGGRKRPAIDDEAADRLSILQVDCTKPFRIRHSCL